jgi:sigma-E factor negative regulatory protein RseC
MGRRDDSQRTSGEYLGVNIMMAEKGVVENIEDNWAWVVTQRKEMCERCGHKGSCSIVQGADRMVIKAKNVAGAKMGDEVELYLSTKTKLKGLFILYMFPVLGLFIGAFSANSLAELTGLNKNVGMVVFTLGGLILAVLLARLLSGRMEASQELRPTISRVIRRATRGSGPLQPHEVTDSPHRLRPPERKALLARGERAHSCCSPK